MTLAELIPLILRASIIIIVFALGLTVLPRDLVGLLGRPGKLALSLFSMFGVMLIAALLITRLFELPGPVEIALIALALAPVPPLLPNKEVKAGGDASYAVALLVAASLFALIWIPITISVLDRFYDAELRASTGRLTGIVITMILAPLAVGSIISRLAPRFAAWVQPAFARMGALLLLLAVIAILAKFWQPIFAQIGDGALIALAAFVVIGLAAGQILGGPEADDRTVLAFSSACRHPGISLALAAMSFPQEKAVAAVIVLYLLVSAILSVPYIAWRKRAGGAISIRP